MRRPLERREAGLQVREVLPIAVRRKELFEQLRLVFVNLLEEYEHVSRENDQKPRGP